MGRRVPRLAAACVAVGFTAAVAAGCASKNQSVVGAGTGAPGTGAASAACAGAGGSSTTRTMDVDGRTRTFIEYLPAGFSAGGGSRYVAIIAFPGRGESAGEFEAYSQLDGVNAIVLYAQGLDGSGGETSWEATPYLTASAHDYEFATDLVSWLAESACVDPDRIDMTGKSDGAGFAASAACGISGVAAVATISGAFYEAGNRCATSGRPLAILNMHGTGDTVIPYDGSAEQGLYSTDAWIKLWHGRDQCAGPVADVNVASDVVQSTWTSCADGSAVVNYRITGGGHTWPGATVDSGPGATTQSVDAAQVISAFFADHPLS
jgi:polyhydroxybutyrate depolymerase